MPRVKIWHLQQSCDGPPIQNESTPFVLDIADRMLLQRENVVFTATKLCHPSRG
jgi:hypothetical protein